jgi:hypothetical protein
VTAPTYRHFEEWRKAVIEHLFTTHGIPRHKGAQMVTEAYAAPSYEMGFDPIRFADEEAASLQAGAPPAGEDKPHVFASMAEARRAHYAHKARIADLEQQVKHLRTDLEQARETAAREVQEELARLRAALRLISQPWLCIPPELPVYDPGFGPPPEARVHDYYKHAPKVAREALNPYPLGGTPAQERFNSDNLDEYIARRRAALDAAAREEGARELQKRILERLPQETVEQIVMSALEEMRVAWDEARDRLGIPRATKIEPAAQDSEEGASNEG